MTERQEMIQHLESLLKSLKETKIYNLDTDQLYDWVREDEVLYGEIIKFLEKEENNV